MPLRDHFRPPVSKMSSSEGFLGQWPGCIVQQLRTQLPPGFVAEPRVRLGTAMEVDIGALERNGTTAQPAGAPAGAHGAVAWPASGLAVAVETDPPDEAEYEVRVYDVEWERRLVSAIELVSPANQDRPKSRESFVAKCAALLRNVVAVSVVDLVTVSHFNLYAQLMSSIGHPDRTMSLDAPAIYAASCRWPTIGARARLEAWSQALVVGQPLPTLPLWLDLDLVVPLDLDASYERACHDLWID